MAGYIGNRAAFLSSTSGADIDGNVTIDGDLTVSGNTVTIDSAQAQEIRLGDNDKMTFGDATGGDLQIYHDGFNSFIKDAGTGYLVIQANAVGFANASNSENLAFFQQDGAVTLHYDGVGKINTASYGVDINGTVNSTGRFLTDAVGYGGGVTSGYQFGGDGNTGMYQDAYDQIQFSTAGTERMRIDSSGNVGIGAQPVALRKLFVSGGSGARSDIQLSYDGLGNTNADGVQLGIQAQGAYIWNFESADNTGDIYFGTANSRKMTLTTGGNLGIGTADPIAKLHVHGSGDLLRLTSTNSGAGGAQLDLIHETSSPADGDINALINMGGYYSGANSAYASSMRSVWTNSGGRQGRLEFYTRNAGDFTKKFQIEHDGDVYSWRVNNWEPIVSSGYSEPSIAYTSSQSFDITPTTPAYSGVRTNSAKYKYFRLEADIRSTAADHYGFFWGADQDNLGYNNSNAGYKWVYRGNNNRPEFRDINLNTTFKHMNAVSHAYNDGVFHRWVMEVLPTGVTLYADGVLVDYLPSNYVPQGYCGIHSYSSGDTLQCRNVVITSLDSTQQESVYYNTTSLAGADDGVYKMVNSQGMMQEVFVSDGWMLVASNDARDSLHPSGVARNSLGYTVNRDGAQGAFGRASPNSDYLIGGFLDDFSFSKIRVIGWGYASTNGTYDWSNRGSWVGAEWSASSLTTVIPRANVSVTGTTGLSTNAAYFVGDGIRVDYNNGGFNANANQITIGGVGTQGSSGDPSTGCYLGHGTTESSGSYEGWYAGNGTAANCQGYTTWVRS